MNFGFELYFTIQLVFESLSGENLLIFKFPSVVIVSFEKEGFDVIGCQMMNG